MSAYHVKKKEDLCSLESKGNEKWPSKRGKELQSSENGCVENKCFEGGECLHILMKVIEKVRYIGLVPGFPKAQWEHQQHSIPNLLSAAKAGLLIIERQQITL